jgi:peptidoglycan-N-acetylglucosamine deacetylase
LLRVLGKTFFPSAVWNIPTKEKTLYLTFDDGPVPEVTPYVLDLLKQYNAKATFFCVGENLKKHPAVFQRILKEGHAVGNHTYHHLKGWKTANENYFEDIKQCDHLVQSKLFRPPYGKMKPSQFTILNSQFSIIMWDVLSKDYDQSLTGEQCLQRVLGKAKNGSIIVFHDSVKAFDRLQYALPKVLEHFSENGFEFKKILL